MRPGVSLTVVYIAGFCLQVVSLPAADLRSDVSKLFALGQKNDATAIAAARDHYVQLKESHPNDPRLDYAYGLVLLNQRDYRGALPLLDRCVQSHRTDHEAARVRLWALLKIGRYQDALDEAVALAQRLPKEAAPQDASTARYLGSVFGYVEKTRMGAVDREIKSDRTNQLLAALGNAYLPTFDEGRSQVYDQFAALQKKQQAYQRKRSLTAQQRQQQLDAEFAQRKGLISEARQALQASSERMQGAGRRLEVISHQISTLAADRARLEAQIMTARALVQVQSQTHSSTIIDPRVLDPNENGFVVASTSATVAQDRAGQLQALAVTLAMLNRRVLHIDRTILALRSEAAMAIDDGQQGTRNLIESTDAIRRADKRASALERARRLAAKPSVPAGRLTAEMTRLSTYLPLPYEEEAKRVLAWFDEEK